MAPGRSIRDYRIGKYRERIRVGPVDRFAMDPRLETDTKSFYLDYDNRTLEIVNIQADVYLFLGN